MGKQCQNCGKTHHLCVGFLGSLFCSNKCVDELVAKLPEVIARDRRIAELREDVVRLARALKASNKRIVERGDACAAKDATIKRLLRLSQKALENAYDAEIEAALKEEKR